MTQREEFEAWWEEFCSAHEDWRFADSDALRWAAWQAAQAVQSAQQDLPDCWVVLENGKIIGTHDEPGHINGNDAIRYVPAQPAHAHAIDTLPERVEKQAGNVQVPEGWQLVPVEPTQAMWSELARDIVFWLYATRSPHHGSKLHSHLKNLGREIPDWLTKEVPDVDHTPPKGTVAVCIYKAMLAAAPSTKEQHNG